MKHRIHLAACLSALAIAAVIAVPASANPGLLHKHGARPLGVPAMLPGQSSAGGVAAARTAPPASGNAATAVIASSVTVFSVVPGSDGAAGAGGVVSGVDGAVVLVPDGLPVGGTLVNGGSAFDPGQLPVCIMPSPHGRGPGPNGRPNVFHHLNPGAIAGDPGAIDAGVVDSGMVMVGGFPAGYDGGGIDVGSVDGAGDIPIVLSAAFPPGGPGRNGAGPGFVHHPLNASMASAASASTADGAGGSGRALAGGLPNRAAGMRTDALATVRHQGRGPMRLGASTTEGVAVSGDDASGSVVQAGGVAEGAAGTTPHDRPSKRATSALTGQSVVPPAATATPRWRERFRLAWPTTK